MLCSVKSNNPDKYNTVSFTIDIPWKCPYVKYYVSSLNTMANFLMSTSEDSIKFLEDTTENVIHFINCFSYSHLTLIKYLKEQTSKLQFEFINRTFTITNETNKKITITDITHRAALLTGLYSTKLPIEIEAGKSYVVRDIPIFQHSKFYLVSLQGDPMYSSLGDREYTPSIIGNIDGMAVDGKPFIYDFDLQGKPIKIKTYTDSLKYLEMSLVDFMYQPIVLCSPLFITVKIKPSKEVDPKNLLSK